LLSAVSAATPIATEIPAGFRRYLSENVSVGGVHDEGASRLNYREFLKDFRYFT
jgi:hypothetical protein